MHRLAHAASALWMTCLLGGCGGSAPEPKEPEPAEAAKKEPALPADDAKTDDSKSDDAKKGDGAKSGSDAKSGGGAEASPPAEKAIRSAKDILTREGVFFEFSFAASEVHQAADKKCDASSKDDPKKKADCMSKAGKQIDGDGIAFRPDEGDKWFWLTIHRTGPKMVPIHKIEVEFVDDSDHTVSLKTMGRDLGTKPGGVPAKVTIDVPSESEITITDPKLGKMVYTAKMGLFGKGDR